MTGEDGELLSIPDEEHMEKAQENVTEVDAISQSIDLAHRAHRALPGSAHNTKNETNHDDMSTLLQNAPPNPDSPLPNPIAREVDEASSQYDAQAQESDDWSDGSGNESQAPLDIKHVLQYLDAVKAEFEQNPHVSPQQCYRKIF